MKHLLPLLALLPAVALFPFTVRAQVTTASMEGVVTDIGAVPLVAATVIAVHEPSGTQYGTTTRDDGRYNLPNLRVGGPYTVTATYVGYESQTVENVSLSLAQKLNLDFGLRNASVELEEIVVSGRLDPDLNNKRTGAATNVSTEQLQRLPTISRSASDYTRLTPASNGNSFAGRNDQYNNFSLDGSIFNNPFGLDAATPGGQTDAQPISLDAIEQIQVSIAPYDVTQAGFTGAAVNAVTKSGTNTFSGTAFAFYRNQDLTGSRVKGTEIFVPELRQFQTGFSLGGPIVKDKLFFFVNAELERREDQGSNFVSAKPGVGGENVSRVESSDLDQVSFILLQRYGYETGIYEGYIHNTNNQKGIFKLDWNISRNHTLTATYNFLDAFKDKPAHPSALGRRGPDATTLQFYNSGYRINNIIHSGILELKSLFGNRMANKLQVGYTKFKDSRDPFSEPFPVVNVNRDGIRYIVAGHEPFSIHNRLDQDVFQFTDNFNIYAGEHTFTVGASLEYFGFNNSFNLGVYEPAGVPYPGGTFGPGFDNVDSLVAFVLRGDMDPVVDHARSFSEAGNWALAETNVGQLAFYGQDEWQLSDRLNLTLGLRLDIPLYFNTPEKIQENIDRNCCYDPSIIYYDEEGESITFDHTELPKQTPLFSPRLGFNFDMHGDQSTQIRGGTGLFSGRFPFVWIGNQVANPNSFFYNVTHPDFKFPQVWRSNLGFDQRVGRGWLITADLIYTNDINAMMVRNYGIKPPSGTLPGVDNRPVYTAEDRSKPTLNDPDANVTNNAYVFTNTSVGNSFNATLQLQRNWPMGLYTSIGYNYLHAEDASSIEAEISGDAYDRNPAYGNVNLARSTPSLYGLRHRIVGAAHKKFTYGNWATTLALFFEYAEGSRFTYTYSGDINNDGSGLNDLIYIPTESQLGEMQFSGNTQQQQGQRQALEAYIEQDDYLNEGRGEYAEKYAILSPWYSTWDVRVLQDFNFAVGQSTHTVQLSIDVINFGNLLNSDWGVRQFPTNTQPIGVSLAEDGTPVYSFDEGLRSTFTNDFSLLSRWQMQIGLRYIF